jgi:hypothetical protein
MSEAQLFFIVGAQKAGTTSLHKYLSAHPDIYMPVEKEVPFFDKENIDAEMWRSYSKKYLAPTGGEVIAGTSTPQYMCDYRIPWRIAEYAPDAKIIIILRDPIERAVSHYKMMVRRGVERRTFDEAIREQLQPESLRVEREKQYEEIMRSGEHDSYVVRGEYKRIINLYHQFFPDSVKIVCSESLREYRRETVVEILRFLGVRENIIPRAISGVYHKSNAGPADMIKRTVAKSDFVRVLAKAFVPKQLRRRIWKKHLSYLGGNVKNITIDECTYRTLAKHFMDENDGLSVCMERWFKNKPNDNDVHSL